MPVAMHLAESRGGAGISEQWHGAISRIARRAKHVGCGGDSARIAAAGLFADAGRSAATLVIHGNYLDDEELAFLAVNRERMSLVYCPRTHAYFRHAPYPLAKALAAGVRVALGTDSRASNPDLDLLAEMRHVARAHPAIDPHEVLRMGTLAGAEALGRDADVGSITPGKLANLIAIPLPEDAGEGWTKRCAGRDPHQRLAAVSGLVSGRAPRRGLAR